MNIYVATLKNDIKYNKAFKNKLIENKISVVKYLKTIQVLIIQTENEITKEEFDFFETLEKESDTFST